jgi:hypothetical protein
MKTALRGKIGRFGVGLLAALAIMGGVAGGLASGTSPTDAAIKWGEHDAAARSAPALPSQANTEATLH